MTVKIEREDKSAQELRQLARRVKDGRVSQRLLAIAMVLEGMRRKVVAENCGMDRQRLCDWVRRYNAEGVEGLCNRRGGGTKLRLTSDQLAKLETWVAEGPDPKRDGVVRWRRKDLAHRIEEDFGIKLHECTVGRYLARLVQKTGGILHVCPGNEHLQLVKPSIWHHKCQLGIAWEPPRIVTD